MKARERSLERGLPPKVTVVGAGMSGSMVACFLAARGLEVEVFDSRNDLRLGFEGPSRSLNMTVSKRGLAVLEDVGLREEVEAIGVPISGRIVHRRDGTTRFFPYGRQADEVLHTVVRNELNGLLLDRAEQFDNVSLRFGKKLIRLDRERANCTFRDLARGRELEVESDLVLGADGAFSAVRREMHRGQRANYRQEFLDWDYKELRIPPGPGGKHRLDPGALHVWPRGGLMLMALPNRDGSFNCICSMPARGPCSFEAFDSVGKVQALFRREFPDFLAAHPEAIEQYLANPQSVFLTTWTWPWSYEDKVVLIGDAAHTVVPFYGQGMISAFEDCWELNRCFDLHGTDWKSGFAAYQESRKASADALARISLDNFVELRDGIQQPWVVARKQAEGILEKAFPKLWKPFYGMVAHTRMPYGEAVRRYRKQQRTARYLGFDVLVGAWGALLALGWRLRGHDPSGIELPPEDPPAASEDSPTVPLSETSHTPRVPAGSAGTGRRS